MKMELNTRMRLAIQALLFLYLAFNGLNISAEEKQNTLEAFAKKNEVVDVKLSPSGKYIAIRRIRDDESRLVVIEVETKKLVSHIEFKRKEQIGSFQWANDERIVIKILSKRYDYASYVFYGELYSFDVTRNKGNMIFGYRIRTLKPKLIKEKLIVEKHRAIYSSWAEIISTLPSDKDHILIAARPYSKKQNKEPRLYLLNVNDGNITFYAESPASHVRYVTDQNGNVAFATSLDKENDKIAFEFQQESKTWKKVEGFTYTNWFTPLLYDSDKKELIFLDGYENDKRSLFKLDVTSKEVTPIFEDSKSDIYWVHIDQSSNRVLGVELNTGYPEYHLVESSKESSELFRELVQVFKGYKINRVSSNLDKTLYSIHVTNDIEPGAWYLYNSQTKKVQFIAKQFEHIDRTKLSRTQPFSFKSRDDETITGQLTLPRIKNETYPAVLLARTHLAGQTTWSYDNTRQFLVSLGYAVVEINNRGSTVYGRRFAELANNHWGDKVQYDLIDGLNYIIDQGIIDKNRVCSMGEFFGGYSAVQLAILDNNLFKCAISKSGFYDLSLYKEEWLDRELPWGKSSFEESLGSAASTLRSFSPSKNLTKIRNPLLIVHGEREEQPSIEQPEKFVEKLERAGKEHVWLELENEDKYIFKEENRVKYLRAVKQFLQKHNPTLN